MRHRAITIATLLLSTLTLVACGPGQVRTETYGYGDRYYQLGRD
jgi:hypothetical protein